MERGLSWVVVPQANRRLPDVWANTTGLPVIALDKMFTFSSSWLIRAMRVDNDGLSTLARLRSMAGDIGNIGHPALAQDPPVTTNLFARQGYPMHLPELSPGMNDRYESVLDTVD